MVIVTVGAYGSEESAFEATTSFICTAPDYFSSLLIISSASPYTSLWPEMDADERLWAMEEELAANQMKTDAIELALKAIMNKLKVPVPEESVMEEDFNFRRNSGILVNSEIYMCWAM